MSDDAYRRDMDIHMHAFKYNVQNLRELDVLSDLGDIKALVLKDAQISLFKDDIEKMSSSQITSAVESYMHRLTYDETFDRSEFDCFLRALHEVDPDHMDQLQRDNYDLKDEVDKALQEVDMDRSKGIER
jgi:hypothetical protein